jgi:hypothetical protein
MRLKSLSAVAVVVAAAATCLTTSSDAASPPTAETPTPAQLQSLTPAAVTLLNSGSPINVVMDPTSGDVLSVTAASAGVRSDISTHNVCDAGNGCYETNKTPYADQGFYGSAGTSTGSWAYRSGYTSGDYTVYGCWASGCGIQISPSSSVSFTSDVTGTSFTIV